MRAFRRTLLVAAGVALLGSVIYLLVLALGGDRLVGVHELPLRVSSHDPRAWMIVALVAAVAALLGWAWTERTLTMATRNEGELQASEREAREERERAETRATRSKRELARQQKQHEQFARAWKAQREWNRQLREQVMELQHRQGVLGRMDVHEMVLQLTVELVEAEKGILLSRHEDSDGAMEIVASVGFIHDPTRSAIAQRFAHEVIKQGDTIRDDGSAAVTEEEHSPADEEVENLLAIPIYLRDDFHGVIVCANREQGFEDMDDEVLVAVGDHAGAVLQNSRLHGELRNAYLATVRTLGSVIEVKDPDLRGHSDAVAEYVLAVADRLEMEPRRREELLFGALLHDVGKVGISERILLKPGPLTDEERSVMQLHPRIGFHLIRQIPALQPIAPAVLHHHERFDGDGYPGGLRGETIPLEARIIAVADAFSAMTTERPYRQPTSVEEACAELERCAGEQFDPQVVRLFVEEVRRRPPEELTPDPDPPDPELELHRPPGSFVIGGSSYGITDSLTLLYSHRHFHETAHAEAQRAAVQQRPFAVLIGCLADLGQINRESGYAAGDAALQAVADSFRRVAGRLNGTAFRVSGRRIGLVVPALPLAGADQVAAELRTELQSGPATWIGVACWEPGESYEQTVERAMRGALGPPVGEPAV